jgi:hypothetical protein
VVKAQIATIRNESGGKHHYYSSCGHTKSDDCLRLSFLEAAVSTFLVNIVEDDQSMLQVQVMSGDGKIAIDAHYSMFAWQSTKERVIAAFQILEAGIEHLNFEAGGDTVVSLMVDVSDFRDVMRFRNSNAIDCLTCKPVIPVSN